MTNIYIYGQHLLQSAVERHDKVETYIQGGCDKMIFQIILLAALFLCIYSHNLLNFRYINGVLLENAHDK